MSRYYHKLMVKFLKWHRDRQLYDPKIDVIDAKIWYHKCRANNNKE